MEKRQFGYAVVDREATIESGNLVVCNTIRQALNHSAKEGFFEISPDYAVYEVAYLPSEVMAPFDGYTLIMVHSNTPVNFVFYGSEE